MSVRAASVRAASVRAPRSRLIGYGIDMALKRVPPNGARVSLPARGFWELEIKAATITVRILTPPDPLSSSLAIALRALTNPNVGDLAGRDLETLAVE
jgi:hypothetical protein